MAYQGKSSAKRSIFIYLILFIIFLIPIFLAGYLFFHKEKLTVKTTNYGYLIQPPFSINQLKIYNKKAQSVTDGKWMLLLIAPNHCNQACRHGLYSMRQVRLATGAQRQRIERAVLSFRNSVKDRRLEKLLKTQYTGTRHFYANKPQFLKVFGKHIGSHNDVKSGVIYVLDPHGNVMMSYQPNANPSKVFKDMERLLKVSQIG